MIDLGQIRKNYSLQNCQVPKLPQVNNLSQIDEKDDLGAIDEPKAYFSVDYEEEREKNNHHPLVGHLTQTTGA